MIGRLDPLQSSLLRTAGTLLSGSGARASLLVLIYHRVLPVVAIDRVSEPEHHTPLQSLAEG